MTIDDVKNIAQCRISAEFKSQSEYARHLGVSRSFVSAVLNGDKLPSKAMLEDLGVIRQVIYEKK